MTAQWRAPLSLMAFAGLAAALVSASPAKAGDFAAYFDRYVPSAIRSEIKAHFDSGSVRKPKGAQAAGPSRPAATPSAAPALAAAPIPIAGVATDAPLARKDNTCLSEHRLETGAVLFRDSCTNEWAINSTRISEHHVDRKCLTKTSHPDGVVVFRDICSQEWAMNTADRSRQSEPEE